MRPIDWLSSSDSLLLAFDASGRPFSPTRAFTVIDQSERYDDLAVALGPGESPSYPERVAEIETWLLKQPGAFATLPDASYVPASIDG